MNWKILLTKLPLGGYAPMYWKETYPSLGEKNQAASMVSVDMTNPSYITQGHGLADVDGDTDPTGTIKGIMKTVASADKTYGISATKVYEITASAIVEKSPDSAITGGEDVVLYGDKLRFSHDTNIGIADNPWANSNEDWWTTVVGGAALTSGEVHQMIVAGTTGILSVLNGSVVANWDGTVDGGVTDAAFDVQDTDIHLVSQVWNTNRFWFAGNKPNVSGRNEASIFVWDGAAPNWENRIEIDGKIGALFVKNGITFVFYQKNLSKGVCTLGYVDGSQIRDVANYEGSLPNWYQVTGYEDFITWASSTALMAWGGGDLNVDTRIFKLGTCGAGGLANPFGTPITASANKLEKFSGYTVTVSWKSLLFDITQDERRSMIDKIKFNFEKLADGARVDYTLKDNKGTSLKTGTISYTLDSTATTKDFNPKCLAENFRVELNWANGSVSAPVSIRDIKIYGHTT